MENFKTEIRSIIAVYIFFFFEKMQDLEEAFS